MKSTPASQNALIRGAASTSLYEQVSRAIEEIVVSGDLADDALLPSENELMRRYGISRGTVRKAIELLEQRGLVSRKVGRGTFINPVARIRRLVWKRLEAVAIPDSRHHLDFTSFVPDFEGSDKCLQRLLQTAEYRKSTVIFAAPDNNLESFRARAVSDGKRLVVATYGLRRGFSLLYDIPDRHIEFAASLDGMEQHGKSITLSDLAALDAIDLVVTGSAAVSRNGILFGKGHGNFDIEWGILRELSLVYDQTPVIACVHDCQVVEEDINAEAHDCAADTIITPTRLIHCTPTQKPPGIFWDRLDHRTLGNIPCLKELLNLL